MIAARALQSPSAESRRRLGGPMTLAVLLPLLLAAGPAPAPVYFEQTTVVLAKGKPSGPGVTARVWYSGARMRMEPGNAPAGTALVLRLDQGKAYRMDPARKRAIAIDLARLRDQSQMDVAMAGQLMGVDAGGVQDGAAAPAARDRRLPLQRLPPERGLDRARRLPDAQDPGGRLRVHGLPRVVGGVAGDGRPGGGAARAARVPAGDALARERDGRDARDPVDHREREGRTRRRPRSSRRPPAGPSCAETGWEE